jgi:hypothetical protein
LFCLREASIKMNNSYKTNTCWDWQGMPYLLSRDCLGTSRNAINLVSFQASGRCDPVRFVIAIRLSGGVAINIRHLFPAGKWNASSRLFLNGKIGRYPSLSLKVMRKHRPFSREKSLAQTGNLFFVFFVPFA